MTQTDHSERLPPIEYFDRGDYFKQNAEDWLSRIGQADAENSGPQSQRCELGAGLTFESMVMSTSDVLRMPPPQPLVGDWLDKGMIASMPGRYGSLKSFALLYMALSVASGEPWFGQPIRSTGGHERVVYVAAEGVYTMGERIKGWCEQVGADSAPEIDWFSGRLDLLDYEHLATFLEHVETTKPGLIVLDTLSKVSSGDENSKESMAKVYNALASLRDASGATVIVAHHTGHGVTGRGRGSSSFEDDIDVVLALHGQAKDGPVKLTSEKQKARRDPSPMWLRLVTTDSGNPAVELATDPDRGDDGNGQLKSLILATVAKYPMQLTRRDFENKDSRGWIEAPRQQIREAVKLLESEERIMFVRAKRAGDRTDQDLLQIHSSRGESQP